ncbi:hypothetical protein N6H14_32245 [Paenibacillus sp. CC-CFT747]|nr:hypothetical protein N6H14_32245 [Paenibacillus sp. CC-CFT747]
MKEARLTHDLAGESFPALTEDGAWCFLRTLEPFIGQGSIKKLISDG